MLKMIRDSRRVESLSRSLRQLLRIPTQHNLLQAFDEWFTRARTGTKRKTLPRKRDVAAAINALLCRHLYDHTPNCASYNASIVRSMILTEIHQYPNLRFEIATILEWIDHLSQVHQHDDVESIVEQLEKLNIPIPTTQLIVWGMRCLDGGGYKKPGSLLLVRKSVRMSPLLDLNRLHFEAIQAAELGDHATARLCFLLCDRWRTPAETLAKEHVSQLAHIVAATTKASDSYAIFLLHGMRRRLKKETMEALVEETVRFIKKRQTERQTELQKFEQEARALPTLPRETVPDITLDASP